MSDLHHLDRRQGRRRAADLLDQFELAGVASKTAATYSGGMRRRLDLAMTLPGELDAAALALGDGARDGQALTLQIPSDGSVKSLRARLEEVADRVAAFAARHRPDSGSALPGGVADDPVAMALLSSPAG